MKKVYFILAAIAMVSMFSCKKDDNKKKGGDDSGDADAIVVIDGKFDDWKALGSKASVADAPEGATYESLIQMKAAADEDNIYMYFEYELVDGQNKSALDILINSDNNAATGFSSWIWDQVGWEFMLESENGFLSDANTFKKIDDMFIYKCVTWKDPNTGEQLDAWGDGAKFDKIENSNTYTESAGVVSNGVAMFEISIPRSIISANKTALTFGVTATNVLANGDWDTAGVLPQYEDGIGTGSMLEVKLP